MINALIGTTLLVLFSFIGIQVDAFYKERNNIIKEWAEFIQECNKQISYFKTDILSIMAHCEQKKISKTVLKMQEQMSSGVGLEVDSVYLNDKEKAIITRYFNGIIGCDIEANTALAECTALDMERQIAVAEKQKKERGELIKKLMMLLGVALLIMVL